MWAANLSEESQNGRAGGRSGDALPSRREPISTRDWDRREARVAIVHAAARNEVRLIFQQGTGVGSWREVVLSRGDFSRLLAGAAWQRCRFTLGREMLLGEAAPARFT